MEILIISGLSGGGKSKAASFLEDMGFYIVDNMPAGMIMKFAEFCAAGNGRYSRVALVYDVRTADTFDEFLEVLNTLRQQKYNCRLLFLEAEVDAIIKRYKETRRLHPLQEQTGSLEAAVNQEIGMMAPVRAQADVVINSTTYSTARLRRELLWLFGGEQRTGEMQVSLVSFGFKHGLPMECSTFALCPTPFILIPCAKRPAWTRRSGSMYFPSRRRSSSWRSCGSCWALSCPCTGRRARRCWWWLSAAPAAGTAPWP